MCRNILPDAEYYITRQLIPPLNRVLKLVGVDAAVWYQQMPKRHLVYSQFRMKTSKSGKKQMGRTLDATWKTAHCLACGAKCGRDQGQQVVLAIPAVRSKCA
jgi:DNA polymerase zeta